MPSYMVKGGNQTLPWTIYEARSIAVCCWHASAPFSRSRFTCSAKRYLQALC